MFNKRAGKLLNNYSRMGLGDETDEILFALLKQDNERAFTQLYNKYWEILLEVAFSKLRSQDDAKDVVQQVFTQIWNRRHTIELIYTFRTYLSAALKYKIYDKILERKKRQAISLDEVYHIGADDNTAENRIDFNKMRSRIEAIVSQLPEKCRMVYKMSREEGLTAKQIAQRLEIHEKTVEGHLTRALRLLKNQLRPPLISVFVFFI